MIPQGIYSKCILFSLGLHGLIAGLAFNTSPSPFMGHHKRPHQTQCRQSFAYNLSTKPSHPIVEVLWTEAKRDAVSQPSPSNPKEQVPLVQALRSAQKPRKAPLPLKQSKQLAPIEEDVRIKEDVRPTTPIITSLDLKNAYMPVPIYPEKAQRLGYTGRIKVRASLNQDGHIKALHILEAEAHDILIKAALETLKKWHFSPETAKKTAIFDIPIHFQLP